MGNYSDQSANKLCTGFQSYNCIIFVSCAACYNCQYYESNPTAI